MEDSVAVKVDNFFKKYSLRKYPKGKILILSGDAVKTVTYLVNGNVKQYDVSPRGDEIVLNIFKPLSFIPMSLIINNKLSEYIYEADTDLDVRQAPAIEVLDFLKNNNDVTFDLLARVYRGLDGQLGRTVRLMSNSSKNRIIYELLVESKRFGKKMAVGKTKLSISEKELGARTGLSRETVSREISHLSKDKLVEARHGDMVVKDTEELEKYLLTSY